MEHLNGLNEGGISWQRPEKKFFLDSDVVRIARNLLGMKLSSMVGGKLTSGLIVETEAYAGVHDRASHASGGRRTRRTETMYQQGGVAYIYLCYGIHALFNVVTNQREIPHAVLVRGILPYEGIDVMESRIGQRLRSGGQDGSGPGKVTRLLGIDCGSNGTDLNESRNIWLESCGLIFDDALIKVTTRIGVSYAGSDALLPYRFLLDPSALLIALKKAAP